MARHNELGNEGEIFAQNYLKRLGYTIKHVNWTFGKLELDIVAEKDGWLVVVEVKTRSTDTFEHPQEAITNKKIKNIVQAAHEYILKYVFYGIIFLMWVLWEEKIAVKSSKQTLQSQKG